MWILLIIAIMKMMEDRKMKAEKEETVTGRIEQKNRPRASLPENPAEYDSFARCLSELRGRFEGRGMMQSVMRDAKRQSVRAMRTRAMAPGAYADYGVRTTVSDRFRTGEYNGERYMTNEDFVRYYEEHRASARPDADMRHMAVVPNEKRNVPAPKRKDPILEPADERSRRFVGRIASKLPASVREKHPVIEQRAAEVHHWLTADTIREAPAERRRRFPVSIASAILVSFISLSLVVGGTVMHSDANAKYRAAAEELSLLEDEANNLEQELSVKLDLVAIEDYAKNTLGMVDKTYVGGTYLAAEKEESIEVYEEEKPAFGLATLLSVFGIGN